MEPHEIFPKEFVPNVEGASYHPKWVGANKAGDAPKWAAFRDALATYKKGDTLAVPDMATKYGRALAAAGRLHMSVTDIGTYYPPEPPPPPPPTGDWESAVAGSGQFTRPSFTPTRTVTCTTASQLQSACTNLLAGDKVVCTGAFTHSGRLFIDKRLTGWAEIHFDNTILIGTQNNTPAVYLKDCERIRCYGGRVLSSAGPGITLHAGQDVTWIDFYVEDCDNTGVYVNPTTRQMNRIRLKGEITNCGLNLALDPHNPASGTGGLEAGTGMHGMYIGGSNFRLNDCYFAVDVHDQPTGAAVQINEIDDSEFWVRAHRITFNAQIQVAGNAIQAWGGSLLRNTFRYIEAADITGHAYENTHFNSSTSMSTCVVLYGRASNYSTNPAVANFAWDTWGGMQYVDVLPASFGQD
jgi:hypothetical protein